MTHTRISLMFLLVLSLLQGCGGEPAPPDVTIKKCTGSSCLSKYADICVASDGVTGVSTTIVNILTNVTISGLLTIGDGSKSHEFTCHPVPPGDYKVTPGDMPKTNGTPPAADLPEVQVKTRVEVVFHYVPTD